MNPCDLFYEDNPWLGKRPLKTKGHLANRELTSLVKEATGNIYAFINRIITIPDKLLSHFQH